MTMYILADFGKINLKNLQKLQKLDVENSKKVLSDLSEGLDSLLEKCDT